MSAEEYRPKPDAGLEQDTTTEQAAAGALLARLAALETDAAPLSEEQLAALYRCAMEKAGLADAAHSAANADGGLESSAGSLSWMKR